MLNTSLFKKGDVVAVALSGGKDSMFLLSLLLAEKDTLGITVKAINVDHSIRGKESENDSEFVKNYCHNRSIPLFFKKVDCIKFSEENGFSLEQGARILRYSVFEEAINSGFSTKVATAHHLEDNFESVLFNVFRGSGLKGLSGISETYNDVIRPILSVSREKIDDYIAKNSVPYVEDSTNSLTDYTRNYIRQIISPKIKEKFENAPNSVLKLSRLAKEEDEFLDSLAKNLIINSENFYKIPVSSPSVLFKRAVIIAIKNLGLKKDYEKGHIERIFGLINKKNGSKITIKNGLIAIREYDYIRIFKNDETIKINTPFKLGEFEFLDKKIVLSLTSQENCLFFDLEKIPSSAVIRNRKKGDVFTKFACGTKKLKDYFIDKKIPLKDRDNIPLLAVDNEILIVFGYEISEKIKTDDRTKKIGHAKLIN